MRLTAAIMPEEPPSRSEPNEPAGQSRPAAPDEHAAAAADDSRGLAVPALRGEVLPRDEGWVQRMLRALFGWKPGSVRSDIAVLLEGSTPTDTGFSAEERTMLKNILGLRERRSEDIMVPRADIVAVDVDTPFPLLVQRMAEDAHSRMPVFRETLDDVVGMVHIKDVLAAVAQGRSVELKDIVRDLTIVAPSMPVVDLLVQMRQKRQHMALVVDEFGGIDGLVTIEDLVEEIVGEIEDEHDEETSPRLVERPDGSILADARVSIEDFEDRVGSFLTEEEREDIDTLGGLVVSLAGRVPGRGEMLTHPSGMEFEIVEADPRRIKRLRVRNAPANSSALAEAG